MMGEPRMVRKSVNLIAAYIYLAYYCHVLFGKLSIVIQSIGFFSFKGMYAIGKRYEIALIFHIRIKRHVQKPTCANFSSFHRVMKK